MCSTTVPVHNDQTLNFAQAIAHTFVELALQKEVFNVLLVKLLTGLASSNVIQVKVWAVVVFMSITHEAEYALSVCCTKHYINKFICIKVCVRVVSCVVGFG